MEEWKVINGHSSYFVSNKGRVKSFKFNKTDGKILSLCNSGTGYYDVKLCENGISETCTIHRLVANAFIPNPENKSDVNHIDGNKKNNNVNNLEWCTESENIKHSYDCLGQKAPWTGKFGYDNIKSKPINQIDIISGKIIKTHGSINYASTKLNICHQNITKCCMNQRQTAGGYKWEYAKDSK